jgi:hypothetical protein
MRIARDTLRQRRYVKDVTSKTHVTSDSRSDPSLHDVRYHASTPGRWPGDGSGIVLSTDEPRFRSHRNPMIPTGGARRDRTDDLLLAKQALSQLSYGPSGDQQSEISNQRKLIERILIADF